MEGKGTILAVVILMLCLGVAACTGCGGDQKGAVFTEEDAQGVIEVRKGETFTVELEENPSTGFAWHCILDQAEVVALQSDHFTAAEEDKIVGAPGTHSFIFQAVQSGSARVEFAYYRPWEPEGIDQTHVFSVKVK